MKFTKAIHWFRRDLRLSDNTALLNARNSTPEVIPVYIASNWKKKHHWTGPGRQRFLSGCLESLSKNLETVGSRLIIRTGPCILELEKLIKETKAEAVFFNRDPDPFGKQSEVKLLELCRSIGIECLGYKDVVLHEESEALTQGGTPYRVYTPYSRCWMELSKAAPQPRITKLASSKILAKLHSDPVPDLNHWQLKDPNIDLPQAGEKAAHQRLKKAVQSTVITRYAEDRNTPSLGGSSFLGPDLRYGTLSPRQVFFQSQKLMESTQNKSERESIFTFQKQLAWREFYMAILAHYPEVLETDFNPKWRGLEWDDPNESDKFKKWQDGQTGFPIIDAGMRQLAQTGYMHNRVRMITAMFLTKDLHIHWRHGEAHFLRHLLDGEVANNNGGWQWSAGTGADAAPYFRIQNPWSQTERFDKDGKYIKHWLPELANVEAKRLSKAPKPLDPLTSDYPLPIVDHGEERAETLERFAKAKGDL